MRNYIERLNRGSLFLEVNSQGSFEIYFLIKPRQWFFCCNFCHDNMFKKNWSGILSFESHNDDTLYKKKWPLVLNFNLESFQKTKKYLRKLTTPTWFFQWLTSNLALCSKLPSNIKTSQCFVTENHKGNLIT